ncbi:MAG: hypothetical protein JSS42_05175 [Proteobacteria bacterium]|uniref:hypothetical protein n=1 Tax=Rudaea sp. TaxID=2136325 RepID=UPI0032206416|nr:hypothetical protein [Pseudomonadota bacterium]
MKRGTTIAAWLALIVGAAGAHAGEVTQQARNVIATVDTLDVEHHWPAGVHVHWESGEPDGKPESGIGKHTHCSAFVAAAAKRLGIYILRPPEHKQILLANAQFDWLANEGASRGWRPLRDAAEAQAQANRGMFVVAAYKNRRDDKPGHIAIVRPGTKSPAVLAGEGPDITQAGARNYRSTTLAQGFAGHPAAWRDREVRFYAHAPESSR